jgi:hypothetical protein
LKRDGEEFKLSHEKLAPARHGTYRYEVVRIAAYIRRADRKWRKMDKEARLAEGYHS